MFYNYIFLILHVIYVNEHKSKYRLIHVSCKKIKINRTMECFIE